MAFADRIRKSFENEGYYGKLSDEEIVTDWVYRSFGHWFSENDVTGFSPFDGYFLSDEDFSECVVNLVDAEVGDTRIGSTPGKRLISRLILQVLGEASRDVTPYYLSISSRDGEILDDKLFLFFSIVYTFDPLGALKWARDTILADGDFCQKRSGNDTPAPLELFLEISIEQFDVSQVREFSKAIFLWARRNTYENDLSAHLPEILELRVMTIDEETQKESTIAVFNQVVRQPRGYGLRSTISEAIMQYFYAKVCIVPELELEALSEELAADLRKYLDAETIAYVKRQHNTGAFKDWLSVPFINLLFFENDDEFESLDIYQQPLREGSLLGLLSRSNGRE